MSLADRVDPGSDLLAELPLAIGLVGLLVAAFLVGAIVGAEAIAAGEPTWPPTALPGLVWGGRATAAFVTVWDVTTGLLWVCSGAVLGATALSALVER